MMRLNAFPLLAGLACSNISLAKGLDRLQASPPDTPAGSANTPPSPSPLAVPATSPTPNPAKQNTQEPGANKDQAAQAATPEAKPPVEVKPGLERFYLATGISWLNLTGSSGGWHSSTASDLEAGFRLVRLAQDIDIFGTFRYRPVAVDIEADFRAYRGIVETYLFGAKGHLPIQSKLTASASFEVGMSQTHINSIDSLRDIDQDLEKSGVDLSIGAGISYLVLDKLGVGSRIALGTGIYKTVQVGLDLRFML